MSQTILLQTCDGSTTTIQFDNNITTSSILQQYRALTGSHEHIKLFDLDNTTPEPQEPLDIHFTSKTFLVLLQSYEAIPDKTTLQSLVNSHCNGTLTDNERLRFGPIEHWNVSRITDMKHLFANQTNFNQPLNNWNVCNVTNMDGMFWGATAFNQPQNIAFIFVTLWTFQLFSG